jgi:hypothetical protein
MFMLILVLTSGLREGVAAIQKPGYPDLAACQTAAKDIKGTADFKWLCVKEPG